MLYFQSLSVLHLQEKITPPPWWVCVDLWSPSRAASLWLASSPANAWSTSAQRTALPSLPARGCQRNTANHLTDTETMQHENKKTTFGRWTNVLFRDPYVSPFTFMFWAQHSLTLHTHLLSVCERVASLSGFFQQRCRNYCCTAQRPHSVSLSFIVLTWLSLRECKQLIQVWPLLHPDIWFCRYLYWSHSSKLTVALFCVYLSICLVVHLSYQSVSVSYSVCCIILAGWMSCYNLFRDQKQCFSILYYTIISGWKEIQAKRL